MSKKQEYHWVFGNGVHLEFQNGGNPIARPSTPMGSSQGCATISDPQNGELLFYTDGFNLWDANHSVVASGLRPHPHRDGTQSAVIVPPVAGGSNYHVFTMQDYLEIPILNSQPPVNQIWHSSYSVSGSGTSVVVQQISPPTVILDGATVTERLTAVCNADGSGYWLIAQQANSEIFHTVPITSDAVPTTSVQSPVSPTTGGWPEMGYMKVSPNADLIVYCDLFSYEVVICDFDSATGQISYRCKILDVPIAYGVEFSPDGQLIYYSTGRGVYQTPIVVADTNHSLSFQVHNTLINSTVDNGLFALQLGPNDKIYVARAEEQFLAVINSPNIAGAGCNFWEYELDSSDNPLQLDGTVMLGLPNFTRFCREKEQSCEEIATQTEETIKQRFDINRARLETCEPVDRHDWCTPAELPKLRPSINIIWEETDCGGIQRKDCAIMLLTISNPYDNLSFSNFIVHKVTVVDQFGEPIGLTSDGKPRAEIVPVGPYCFDDIGPCDYKAREFTLHSRDTEPGEYQILVEGVCYDVCWHGNDKACFNLKVCEK